MPTELGGFGLQGGPTLSNMVSAGGGVGHGGGGGLPHQMLGSGGHSRRGGGFGGKPKRSRCTFAGCQSHGMLYTLRVRL